MASCCCCCCCSAWLGMAAAAVDGTDADLPAAAALAVVAAAGVVVVELGPVVVVVGMGMSAVVVVVLGVGEVLLLLEAPRSQSYTCCVVVGLVVVYGGCERLEGVNQIPISHVCCIPHTRLGEAAEDGLRGLVDAGLDLVEGGLQHHGGRGQVDVHLEEGLHRGRRLLLLLLELAAVVVWVCVCVCVRRLVYGEVAFNWDRVYAPARGGGGVEEGARGDALFKGVHAVLGTVEEGLCVCVLAVGWRRAEFSWI